MEYKNLPFNLKCETFKSKVTNLLNTSELYYNSVKVESSNAEKEAAEAADEKTAQPAEDVDKVSEEDTTVEG